MINCLASGNSSGYVDNTQAVLANLPLSMDPVLCKLIGDVHIEID